MFTALMLLAATAIADPAPAQPATQGASRDSSEIVVEARRNRNREIRAFVSALTPSRVGDQLARFDNAVCPASVGLPAVQNAQVVARLRAVASAAGIKVARGECTPNALMIVVADKDQFVAALRKKYPGYFVDPIGMKVRVPDEPGPAIAWQVKGLLDSNGIRPPVVRPPSGGEYYSVETTMASRLKPSSRPDFLTSVVVVEVGALTGITTTQLADYAAMRLYSQANPARLANNGQQTILKIIDAPLDSQIPLTMTAWDLAFLKSLYRSEPLQYSTHQRAAIGREFRRELDKE
jgi:hypothetical protein